LTDAERLVLFGFAEDGSRTDADVAKRIGLGESTVCMVRRKLVSENHLEFWNLPSFNRLGCDIVVFFLQETSLAAPINEKAEAYRTFFRHNPQVFDSLMSEDVIIFMAAFRRLSEYVLFLDRYEAFFGGSRLLRGLLQKVIFPLDITMGNAGYNFAPSLYRIFGLTVEEPYYRKPEFMEIEETKLNRVKANGLTRIIESPCATDSQIGRTLRRSRQRVTEMRNEFRRKGLYERIAVPTFNSSEFGVIAYAHLEFNPVTSFEKKVDVAGDDWWRQSFGTLHRDSEVVVCYVFRDFRECASFLEDHIAPFKKEGLVLKDPNIHVLSTENLVDPIDNGFGQLARWILS
jgi:hypothetical protein